MPCLSPLITGKGRNTINRVSIITGQTASTITVNKTPVLAPQTARESIFEIQEITKSRGKR